jgi:Ran GTPase-activating protein (RanGAP) involved in mRNA processing and transport
MNMIVVQNCSIEKTSENSVPVILHHLFRLIMYSDNALNPGGAEAIRILLETCLTLKTIKLNNTGVGPAGGEVHVPYVHS